MKPRCPTPLGTETPFSNDRRPKAAEEQRGTFAQRTVQPILAPCFFSTNCLAFFFISFFKLLKSDLLHRSNVRMTKKMKAGCFFLKHPSVLKIISLPFIYPDNTALRTTAFFNTNLQSGVRHKMQEFANNSNACHFAALYFFRCSRDAQRSKFSFEIAFCAS